MVHLSPILSTMYVLTGNIYIFGTGYALIKSNHECNSLDTKLGHADTLTECITLCRNKRGCKYFVYENNGGVESCWWEHTTDASCPEGWEEDAFDFYELKGKIWYIANSILDRIPHINLENKINLA